MHSTSRVGSLLLCCVATSFHAYPAAAQTAVTRERVNLRADSLMAAPVSRVLPRGSRVTVLGERSQVTGFVRVRSASGREGWIFEDFLLPEEPAAPPTAAPGVVACGHKCGVQRWSIKTLTDAAATQVDSTPQDVTVQHLRSIPAPKPLPDDTRLAPVEFTTFRVRARLVAWKKEDDEDLHLVLADPHNSHRTIIAEVPNSTCQLVCSSASVNRFLQARNALIARLGPPPASFKTPHPMPLVTVTGVGFFDFIHGQNGVAPNGFELHPVTSIVFEN